MLRRDLLAALASGRHPNPLLPLAAGIQPHAPTSMQPQTLPIASNTYPAGGSDAAELHRALNVSNRRLDGRHTS